MPYFMNDILISFFEVAGLINIEQLSGWFFVAALSVIENLRYTCILNLINFNELIYE